MEMERSRNGLSEGLAREPLPHLSSALVWMEPVVTQQCAEDREWRINIAQTQRRAGQDYQTHYTALC